MKKVIYFLGVFIALAVIIVACEKAIDDKTDLNQPESALKAGNNCATIQSGTIPYSAGHYLSGEFISTGYDIFGYNYQAHLFNGTYANIYLGRDGFPPYEGDDDAYLAENPEAANHWAWPYRTTEVLMKWNDAWLSKKDCDGDGLLDRHYGHDSYIGSGAWETNHMWGTYEEGGELCDWNYFVKIIAVPDDAEKVSGVWYNADGIEIGPDIWGQFAIIQQVENDPCAGIQGIQYRSPDHPGFGGW
ncbi:MAG: hypothetical protein KAT48_14770 [Bacteroidales bacterium]|nr:hypothetical protein [Bacteroidales bacterium]